MKGKRFLLIRNHETLNNKAEQELEKLKNEFEDLGTAWLLKEALRNIYTMVNNSATARLAFNLWCDKAVKSGTACLKTMTKTISSHIEGILEYWRHGFFINASHEGFNNMVRSG